MEKKVQKPEINKAELKKADEIKQKALKNGKIVKK